MVQNMMESGRMENIMEWVHFYGLMEASTKGSGVTAKKMVVANFKVKTVRFMKVTGKTANIMEEANYRHQMAKYLQVHLKVVNS